MQIDMCHKQIDRQVDRYVSTNRQIDRQIDMCLQIDRQIGRQICVINRQIDRQIDDIDIKIVRQIDRKIDRQIEIQKANETGFNRYCIDDDIDIDLNAKDA